MDISLVTRFYGLVGRLCAPCLCVRFVLFYSQTFSEHRWRRL